MMQRRPFNPFGGLMVQDVTFLLTNVDLERVYKITFFLSISSAEEALRAACKAYDRCARIAMNGECLFVYNEERRRKPIAFPKPVNTPNIYAPDSERVHAYMLKRMNVKRLEELRLYACLATRHELMSLMIHFMDFVTRLRLSLRPLFRESDVRVERVKFDFLP